MHSITLKELHEILLNIGKEFHKICTDNNIPYYMIGGTQLGAIRHNGFIPWDDDMDFGVPRKYFNKCIVCLEKELPTRYRLLTIDNSGYVNGMFIKIIDLQTVANYHYVKEAKEEYGINIDIFPLDRTTNQKSFLSKNWWIYFLRGIDSYRLFCLDELPLCKRAVSDIIKVILSPLSKTSINSFIINHLIDNEGDFIANHGGLYKEKEIVHESCFGNPTLYHFEDTDFFGVSDYEKYLNSLYGDWRKLPPVDKQHTHLEDIYVK